MRTTDILAAADQYEKNFFARKKFRARKRAKSKDAGRNHKKTLWHGRGKSRIDFRFIDACEDFKRCSDEWYCYPYYRTIPPSEVYYHNRRDWEMAERRENEAWEEHRELLNRNNWNGEIFEGVVLNKHDEKLDDCAMCVLPFFEGDRLVAAPFDEKVSYRQALLQPRPQVLRTIGEGQVLRSGVEDSVCNSCMLQYLVSESCHIVASRAHWADETPCIPCPRCYNSELSVPAVLHFLSTQNSDDPLVRDTIAIMDERLVRYVMAARATSDPDHIISACVKCEQVFMVDTTSSCSHIVCPLCHTEMCWVCKDAYHYGQTCKQAIAASPSLSWRNENTRQCPRCHEAVEKNGGCDHMHCAVCALDYSWRAAPNGIYMTPSSQKYCLISPVIEGNRKNASDIEKETLRQLREAKRRERLLKKRAKNVNDPFYTQQRHDIPGMSYCDSKSERRRRARKRQRKSRLQKKAVRHLQSSIEIGDLIDIEELVRSFRDQQSKAAAIDTAKMHANAPSNDVPVFMRAIAI